MTSLSSLTLQDLGLAYRKAKADLYYSSHASLFAIAEYEESLQENLESLLEKINGVNESWVNDESFLGSWTLITKSIDWSFKDDFYKKNGNGLTFSSSKKEWENSCELLASTNDYQPPTAEFRLMADCTIDFHVLSALWIMKVGHSYDEKLTKNAYGNRLRRNKNGLFNPYSLGSFKPYLKPFRSWRDNGIQAMHDALDKNKSIVALTADVSSFYHKLNANFMLDEKFNEILKIELDDDNQKLHRLFIRALIGWAQRTPLKKGLPVGLPASSIVANMALIEFDQIIEEQVIPLYYGRYVDDIMLVMEDSARFKSASDLWEWLFARSGGMLSGDYEEKSNEELETTKSQLKSVSFKAEYLPNSKIVFANAKNKVFLLSGKTGKTLVDVISHQIHQRASEWRALPNLPNSPDEISTDLVTATQSNGEIADNLRKTDALTMRRANFAIKLRDFEAYERDLSPKAWQAHRHAFFQAFIDHVLVIPYFFELSTYLPRVIRLATACEDFEYLERLINELNYIYETIEKHCLLDIKACPKGELPTKKELIRVWKTRLDNTIQESISAAFPPRLTRTGKLSWESHKNQDALDGLSIKHLQAKQAKLFSFDLAHLPFRFITLPKEMINQRGIPPKESILYVETPEALLCDDITSGIKKLTERINIKTGLPYGMLFATRPFNLTELYLLEDDAFEKKGREDLQAIVVATRGFNLNEKLPCYDKNNVLQIPDGEYQPKLTVAVSSWHTNDKSWIASTNKESDPDRGRYTRLNNLINSLISYPHNTRYFILPELALPAQWFMRIALGLQRRGISLITGIEYLHTKRKCVRNQVWAALTHDGLGFPSMMIYRQDKQTPALHEEKELQRVNGLKMQPARTWKGGKSKPPIIQHGDFRFAMLICSELTNIRYRASLRGEIDALFVPEWNQDIDTFNALVESAALDIHAYIIQCNDRKYGDSRIRAPYKDSWRRDILRVKGGLRDYYVTGEIDIETLRRFQSSHRSTSAPFKPVPDGFKLSHARKALPIALTKET